MRVSLFTVRLWGSGRRSGSIAGKIALAGLAALLVLGGCGGDPSRGQAGARTASGTGPVVVCTTGMIGDLASRLVSDRGTVVTLMGPGVDPHLYKATPSDLVAMQRADLILYNGLHLEGKMADLFARLREQGRRTVAVAEAIPRDRLLSARGAGDAVDPHVWFDVELWTLALGRVRDALLEADPAGRAEYEAREAAYRAELDELQQWCRRAAESVRVERRVLVTSHDAFGYFGRAYGFEVVALQGISTVAEAGLADVTALVRFIRERGIPAIFVESSVSPAMIRRVAEDAGARVGGELYSDAVGPSGSPAGTYPGMIRHNVRTIAGALGGSVEEVPHAP